MTKDPGASALDYVNTLELPVAPTALEGPVDDSTGAAFQTAKNQASVVGSELISFVKGVTPESRQAIANSALLAQLAANKAVPPNGDIYRWYDRYFDVLGKIGWIIQDKGFTTYKASGNGFEAHEAILDVAASLLSPAASTAVILNETIKALRSLKDANSPLITLFDRQSQHAQAARFQVSLVQDNADKDFMVALLAFGLEANTKVTQVLFFRYRSSDATLKHMSGKVTITPEIMARVAPAIDAKVAAFQTSFVRTLDLPDV